MSVELFPIQQTGGGRIGTVNLSYRDMEEAIGFPPNATDLDDPDKVKASWGFRDGEGREAFAWCYRYDRPEDCYEWSCCGSDALLLDVFGSAYHSSRRW